MNFRSVRPHSSKLAITLTLTALASSALAAGVPSESERLLDVGKLWVTVQLFHPAVARGQVDWDRVLIRSLPGIRSAQNQKEYETALAGMLASLHDSRAHLAPENAPAVPIEAAGAIRTCVYYGPKRGFLLSSGEPELSLIPMGGGVEAIVPLSEPASPHDSDTLAATDNRYDTAAYPNTENRILAAYEVWGRIRYFFAYRDLMDADWDTLFPAFLNQFINAKNAREYHLAVAQAIGEIGDSHAGAASAELNAYFGVAGPGIRVRLIEKKPLVTEIDDPEAKKQGVAIGDILMEVDGESSVARIDRESQYLSFSTRQALSDEVSRRLLNGPEGSTVRLKFRDKGGNLKEVNLRRSSSFESGLVKKTEAAYRRLTGNLGYVDLTRLTPDQVDAMFSDLADTAAIIFDGRGELHVNPTLIAARLARKKDVAGAIITGPVHFGPDLPEFQTLTKTASFFKVETVPASNKPIYKNPTAMLIDERTSGATEHLGLLLEAANNTAFIGSSSAGADGEITGFEIPGGLTIRFSTTDVRHGNSGKLQGIGLQPTVMAPATLHGIRSGQDEALDAAIRYLTDNAPATAARLTAMVR